MTLNKQQIQWKEFEEIHMNLWTRIKKTRKQVQIPPITK